MPPDDRERLAALHAQSRAAMRAGDFDMYGRLNQALHRVIIEGCGNPVLMEMSVSLRHRVSPYRRS